MRLVLFDRSDASRIHFEPLALCRPIWELRCGMKSLGERMISQLGPRDVAGFVPDYMSEVYREQSGWTVNSAASLAGDDLLLVNARVKPESLPQAVGPSLAAFGPDGDCFFARIAAADSAKLNGTSLDALIASAREALPRYDGPVATWEFIWDLILSNPDQLREDFAAAGRKGNHGSAEQPLALRGSPDDVYIAEGAKLHPMVVIDAVHGPVYIDEGAEIHPFTRIEGPCYVGKHSLLLGAKCREGNSIGPHCRVGGEIEESIIQGYSNKYHDGFLGHAYVGEWVNLGALTTNSDLKNDYSNVSVILDGKTAIDTGSRKVGSLIGDHTKTSIGTLFNTGSYVGSMALITGTGKPLPKYIPSFAWFLEGVVTKGFGKSTLYATARTAMGRRNVEWTPALEAMWDQVFHLTAEPRLDAIKKGRRALRAQRA